MKEAGGGSVSDRAIPNGAAAPKSHTLILPPTSSSGTNPMVDTCTARGRLVEEDLLSGVAADGDVVHRAIELHSQRSC